MRPAWMRSSKGEAAEETNNTGIDKSVWQEQRYGRSLMLTSKIKTLKGKAYEVPAEMMSMTTGARPKYKAEKKETPEEEVKKQDASTSLAKKEAGNGADDAATNGASMPPPEEEPPVPPSQADGAVENGEQGGKKKKASKTNGDVSPTVKPKKASSFDLDGGGPYENLPGDSKDIMKLKKKLREIHKIEEGISSGTKQEPNQVEKVTKKAGYLEELKLLESIVHSAGIPNGS